MSPLDARVLVLAAEIGRDWGQVQGHLARARSADPTRSEADAALVALSLDHAYQAFETLLVRLETALGLPPREGAGWHAQLLSDAQLSVAGLRPALFPSEVARDWESLRRFRHFLRHAYAVELDPEQLRSGIAHLERAVAATSGNVEAIVAALTAP